MERKHYITFNANKNATECEASVKNFKTITDIISEKLDNYYEKIALNERALLDDLEPTEELIKIFNPVNYGYRVLKEIAGNKKCEIDYIGLMRDIDDYSKFKKEIYDDLTDDMVQFLKLQEKEKEE